MEIEQLLASVAVTVYVIFPVKLLKLEGATKFAIGKIGIDDDEFPKKLDKDTDIIDKLVPIPMIVGDDI